MSKETITELSKQKLGKYIKAAAKKAGDHDYMAGQMDGDGITGLAKKYTGVANKRRAGMEKAVSKLTEQRHKVEVTYTDRDHKFQQTARNKSYDLSGEDNKEPYHTETDHQKKTFGVTAKSKAHAINRAATSVSKKNFKVVSVKYHGVMEAKQAPERIEPHFGAPKPKPGERIEPHFGDAPKHTHSTSSDNNEKHATHKFVINSNNSVDYHDANGTKKEFLPAMTHKSTAMAMVIKGVRIVSQNNPHAKIHVKDASGEYTKRANTLKKTVTYHDLPHHTYGEAVDWDSDSKKEREVSHWNIVNTRTKKNVGKATTKKGARSAVDRHDNNYGAYAHRAIPVWKESVETEDNTIMEASPKKLKDIVNKPSRKWNELDGNTKDEQEIIANIRKNTVVHADANGNGDDVFKGSKLKRDKKHVAPGEDEKIYGANNGDVSNIKEAWERNARPVPINSRHIDMHWATQHIAPVGSKISTHANKVVIHHPDGSEHHIEGGQQHQSEVKYNNKSGKDKSHAEAGKYVVVKRTADSSTKIAGGRFVAQNKAGSNGYTKYTHDETKAKEFKTLEHAQNHVSYHSQHLPTHGDHFEIHQKRSGQKIKADIAKNKKATAEYHASFSKALSSGGDPLRDEKVHQARNKLRSTIHPGLRN